MSALPDSAACVPHGDCLLGQPHAVVLGAGADLLVSLACAAVLLALLAVRRSRPALRFRGPVALFAAFAVLCGLTQLVSALAPWVPTGALHGPLRLLTGLAAGATAVVLLTLVPKIAAMPGPRQLEQAHAALLSEIEAHRGTLARLHEAERDVEARIAHRTAELDAANRQLSLTSHEAAHRSANLAAVILSMARETARRAPDLPAFMERFTGRVSALARATSSLSGAAAGAGLSMRDVVRGQLAPMLDTFGDRIALDGPPVEVDAREAQHVALAVHELATNAVKHGALSVPQGRVDAGWRQDGGDIVLAWRETGAAQPPQPTARGFGTTLLMLAVPNALRGTAARTLDADGLLYELRFPAAAAHGPGVAGAAGATVPA